jgi:hypothetical protein
MFSIRADMRLGSLTLQKTIPYTDSRGRQLDHKGSG